MSQLVLFNRCLLINFFCQHRSFLIVNITLFPSLLIIILPSLSPSHAFSLCLSLSFSVSLTTFTTISPFFYSSPYLSVFINGILKVSLTISLRFYPYSPAFLLSLSLTRFVILSRAFHRFPLSLSLSLCLTHLLPILLSLFLSLSPFPPFALSLHQFDYIIIWAADVSDRRSLHPLSSLLYHAAGSSYIRYIYQ